MNWPAFGEQPTTLELWKPVCTETADKREAEEARRSHTHTWTHPQHPCTHAHTHTCSFLLLLFSFAACLVVCCLKASLSLMGPHGTLLAYVCVYVCVPSPNAIDFTPQTRRLLFSSIFIYLLFYFYFSPIYLERKWILNRDNNNMVKWIIIISDHLKEMNILSLEWFFFFF